MPKMTRTEAELNGLVRKGIQVKQDHPTLGDSHESGKIHRRGG
jgi:hypothetical protein